MKSKKRENSSGSSSSSSSSDSSSSDSGSSRSSSEDRANRNKKHEKGSSSKSKAHEEEHSKSRKRELSATQSTEDDLKKTKRDEYYPKHSRFGNDDRSSSHYHSGREGQEHSRKERYRNRDDESRSSKYEDRNDRKRNYDDKRREDDKPRRYDDRESGRYDYHDRKRDSYNYKQGNYRGRNRADEDRKGSPSSGNRFKHNDNRRDNKFRNRRDRSRSGSFDHAGAVWGKQDQANGKKDKPKPIDKEKPNFGLSGKLTEETNTYRGVVIKYSEPPEARKPKRRWRLYPFKGEKALQTLYIHRESAYLIGRDRKVVDLPVDHPSCSKQHAALQYRLVPFTREDGSAGKRVRPYLIDLDSSNGTYINNKKIDPKKYVELLEKDVIKFGFSSREYVLLHENSKDETQDDDVKQEEEEVNVKEEPAH